MKQLLTIAIIAIAIFGSLTGIRASAEVYTMHFPSQIDIDSELGTSNNKLELAPASSQQDCLALAMINGYNPQLPKSEDNWIDCNFKN